MKQQQIVTGTTRNTQTVLYLRSPSGRSLPY